MMSFDNDMEPGSDGCTEHSGLTDSWAAHGDPLPNHFALPFLVFHGDLTPPRPPLLSAVISTMLLTFFNQFADISTWGLPIFFF
jgi:hypothetical protein